MDSLHTSLLRKVTSRYSFEIPMGKPLTLTLIGAVAGLDLKSNQVLWRRVYGSQQVLDLGMLQLNSKKMSAKKVYTVSALRGIPGGVSVKLWDAQRGGINWEKEIAKGAYLSYICFP